MASFTCHVLGGTKRLRLERVVRQLLPSNANRLPPLVAPNPEAGTLQQVALLFRETTPRDSDDGRYRPFATRRKAKYAAASARRTEAKSTAGSSHAGEPPKDFTTCGPTSVPATDPTRANRKRVRA